MKIKKLLAVLAAGIIALGIPAMTAFAEDTDSEDPWGDDYSYEEDSEAETADITSADGQYTYTTATDDEGKQYAVLESYLGTDIDVVIPEEIDGIKVQELGDRTYFMNETIKSITISENVEDFGYYSFYGCTALTEYKVNDKNEIYKSVDGILFGKDGLSLISYPVGLKTVEYTVPDEVQAIASSAFALCTSLEKITLPEDCIYIGKYCFAECAALTSVDIPDNVTELGQSAFAGCTSLSDVQLPKNLQILDAAAFYQCSSLTEIEWPDNLYSIGQACFASTGLKSITIPGTISEIGYSAFGFNTNADDEFILDGNFVIYGYTGSYAQSYATENKITFVTLDVQQTDKGLSTLQIVLICAGGVIVLAAIVVIVVIVVKKRKKKKLAAGMKSADEIRQDLLDMAEDCSDEESVTDNVAAQEDCNDNETTEE